MGGSYITRKILPDKSLALQQQSWSFAACRGKPPKGAWDGNEGPLCLLHKLVTSPFHFILWTNLIISLPPRPTSCVHSYSGGQLINISLCGSKDCCSIKKRRRNEIWMRPLWSSRCVKCDLIWGRAMRRGKGDNWREHRQDRETSDLLNSSQSAKTAELDLTEQPTDRELPKSISFTDQDEHHINLWPIC